MCDNKNRLCFFKDRKLHKYVYAYELVPYLHESEIHWESQVAQQLITKQNTKKHTHFF